MCTVKQSEEEEGRKQVKREDEGIRRVCKSEEEVSTLLPQRPSAQNDSCFLLLRADPVICVYVCVRMCTLYAFALDPDWSWTFEADTDIQICLNKDNLQLNNKLQKKIKDEC